MKVIYFHQHFSTPDGSAGLRSYEMARALIRRGHQVTMVCGSYSAGKTGLSQRFNKGVRRGVVDGIDVVELDLNYSNSDGLLKRTWTFLKFAVRSIGLALTEKYDLVFATTTPLTAGIPGIFARWLRSKPFVFEVRDLWPELPKAMGVVHNPLVLCALGALEWLSYHSAHRLIGLSPGIVEGICNRGIDPQRVTAIPNGCDLNIFSVPVEPWSPPGIAPHDLVAIFAGTHGQANGLDAVLDAAAELKARGHQEIKLLLIGNGKLKAGLVSRARQEGLYNVIFLDPVNKARLAQLMARSDLGLQVLADVPAFYYGTSPNKFFDYIAASKPVLNNYPGWLAELIEANQCGFVVPPGNAKAFADALESAATNPASLKAMGERSLALARAEFDRRELGERWVDWIEGTAKP
ncbi:glycosyltransferase family 4 protein [Devosia sp.]|uniref:glycosyltransferase family 4 protein n=1 Tax=Devosia sp. TaxID=1871048 RepID=UPI001B27D667|nr:glycosyltransferase family 4 protein [Devosia sp.]MBO9591135.1 glycosyltransferase family 4 protein [Devosia sp.]